MTSRKHRARRGQRSARGSALALALACLGGCASAPDGSQGALMEYLERVRQLEAHGAPLEPGSEAERAAIEQFQDLLGDFKAPEFRRRVKEIYADQLFFNDTLKTIRNSSDLEEYLGASADALDLGLVEFLDYTSSHGNYYFRWRMTLQFKQLARGRETTSVGMSHVRFDADGRVVLHQDFWDSAGGLFEHVPGLGWMIGKVKRRL